MSESAASTYRTEHALLVLLGQYAQQIGLIKALMAVPLHQQARTYSPQTKVLEFLVAILAGLPHLKDISLLGPSPGPGSGHEAQAWGQPGLGQLQWGGPDAPSAQPRRGRGHCARAGRDQSSASGPAGHPSPDRARSAGVRW